MSKRMVEMMVRCKTCWSWGVKGPGQAGDRYRVRVPYKVVVQTPAPFDLGWVRCPASHVTQLAHSILPDDALPAPVNVEIPRGRWRATEQELLPKPPTPAQVRAQHRNWSIHQIRGLHSTLAGLHQVTHRDGCVAVNALSNENLALLREARDLIQRVMDNFDRGVV